MKIGIRRGFAMLLLGAMPFEINFAPADSAQTTVQFFGGVGQYALIRRGCEGEVLEKQGVPFRELSAAVEHKFAAPVRLGIRSSYIFGKQKVEAVFYDPTRGYQTITRFVSRDNFAMNPYLDLEWKSFGIGGGYFRARHPLAGNDNIEGIDSPISAYLRFGNRRAVYVSTSFLHHLHFYTGGYCHLGVGSGKNSNFDWWLGLGFVGPYDKAGLLFKSDIHLQRHFKLNVLTRLGVSEGISESAIGLGLTYY
ncbi:MAG: hypothetical protein ACREOI_12245 [bacterium]